MELSLANIINISIADAPAGAGEYNTSNLACFTEEAYDTDSFGDLGYKLYLSPDDVATDFGSASKTYAMALAAFSQAPNILAGGGYFVVIPFIPEAQSVAPTGADPTSGVFQLQYGASTTSNLAFNATAAAIQTALRLIAGLEGVVVTGTDVGTGDLVITFNGVYGNISLLTIAGSTLDHPLTVTQTVAGETYAEAITRASALVQFFGLMATQIFSSSPMLAAAAVIQTKTKIGFFASKTAADVAPAGLLDLLRTGGYDQSRGLFHVGTDATELEALQMMAAYASRLLSVDFSGSRTTITMHLKDLKTIQPNSVMTQTLLAQCVAAGVDVYASFQGVPKVFTSGENTFSDRVYNKLWFKGALEIAGFNLLAQVSTKIPQTEDGMDMLKGAYRRVCEQALTNLYAAPGTWTLPNTFGNQADFFANIEQRGYFIYSQPISQQSPTERADRDAPLVQIALKEAGAIHKSNVLVNINA